MKYYWVWEATCMLWTIPCFLIQCERDTVVSLASLHAYVVSHAMLVDSVWTRYRRCFSKLSCLCSRSKSETPFSLCYNSDQSRPLCHTAEIWRCLWCMSRATSPIKTRKRKRNQAESYISSWKKQGTYQPRTPMASQTRFAKGTVCFYECLNELTHGLKS